MGKGISRYKLDVEDPGVMCTHRYRIDICLGVTLTRRQLLITRYRLDVKTLMLLVPTSTGQTSAVESLRLHGSFCQCLHRGTDSSLAKKLVARSHGDRAGKSQQHTLS